VIGRNRTGPRKPACAPATRRATCRRPLGLEWLEERALLSVAGPGPEEGLAPSPPGDAAVSDGSLAAEFAADASLVRMGKPAPGQPGGLAPNAHLSASGAHAGGASEARVHNAAPVVVHPIPDVAVDEDASDTVIDLGDVFQDPGDTLTYRVTVSAAEALVVDRVCREHYTHLLNDCLFAHRGDDRGYGPEHDLARQNIASFFEYVGLETTLEPFSYKGEEYYNVVGVKPGVVNPNAIYVLGAHFDAANCPGADDNASGVAGMMEIARAMAPYQFASTITFIAFDREEQGHYGSIAYAAAHARDNILGMVNVDMIAYNPDGPNKNGVALYDYAGGGAIKSDLLAAFDAYGAGVWAADRGQSGYSDHKSFEEQGFDAAWVAEHEWWENPQRNHAGDEIERPNYLDYRFATKVTSATAGYLVAAAGLVDATSLLSAAVGGDLLTLDYLDEQNGTVQITVRATDAMGAWVEDRFRVEVGPVNDPPRVRQPIQDVPIPEATVETRVDLTAAFDDADIIPNGDVLTFSVAANTNPGLVGTRLHGDDLVLSHTAGQTGAAAITVRARDRAGAWVDDTFTVGESPVLAGTSEDDSFEIAAGPSGSWTVNVNGVAHSFGPEIETIEIDGLGGRDTVTFTGTDGREIVDLWPDRGVLAGEGHTVAVAHVEAITVHGGGGTDDVAKLHDSNGPDTLRIAPGSAVLSGAGYTLTASGFPSVLGYASADGHTDTAILDDLNGSEDLFRGWPTQVRMSGEGFFHRAMGFDEVHARASDAEDTAQLYDSAGADAFEAYADRGTMSYADGRTVEAAGFRWLLAYASDDGHCDTARLQDTTADLGISYATWFKAYEDTGKMYDVSGFYNRVRGFDEVIASAVGDDDTARLYDSPGADEFEAHADRGTMSYADGRTVEAAGFRWLLAYASDDGHGDTARLQDTTADLATSYATWFKADHHRGKMYDVSAFYSQVRDFDEVVAFAVGDDDTAKLYDSLGADGLEAYADRGTMSYADGRTVEAAGFRWLFAYASDDGRPDTARFYDTTADRAASHATRFIAAADFGKMYAASAFFNRAEGFDGVSASVAGDDDTASLVDSPRSDVYRSRPDHSRMDYDDGTFAEAIGFRDVCAFSATGGVDTAYLYDSPGDDRFDAWPQVARIECGSFSSESRDFEQGGAIAQNREDDDSAYAHGETAWQAVGDWEGGTMTPRLAPVADAGGPYAGDEGSDVTLDASASYDPDGTIVRYAWDLDGDGRYDDAAGVTATFRSDTPGIHTVGIQVTDDDGAWHTDAATVTVRPVGGPALGMGVAQARTDQWTPVALSRTYDSMVVVLTPNYDESLPPMVARVRNAAGDRFEMKLDRADGRSGAIAGVNVHYVVVEEGVYTPAEHGVRMEAVKFVSTRTDGKTSWVGQRRSYQQPYAQPAVVGQVMTANDPGWSVFWARGADRSEPPSSSDLYVGKHVGEDPDDTREDETLGYVVIEAGTGSIGGIAYVAGLGSDTVEGMHDSPPFRYDINLANAKFAGLSQAGMDRGNGGWPVLYGSTPVTDTGLRLAIDEDQMSDSERAHTTDQVAYIVLDPPVGASAQSQGVPGFDGEPTGTSCERAVDLAIADLWASSRSDEEEKTLVSLTGDGLGADLLAELMRTWNR
jgi:hypothetical protein